MAKVWVSWVPAFALHPDTHLPFLTARYEERDELDDSPRQSVEATCAECGVEFRTVCDSGQPRRHIQLFAKTHHDLHFRKYAPRLP